VSGSGGGGRLTKGHRFLLRLCLGNVAHRRESDSVDGRGACDPSGGILRFCRHRRSLRPGRGCHEQWGRLQPLLWQRLRLFAASKLTACLRRTQELLLL
jgi:hypothetical protein